MRASVIFVLLTILWASAPASAQQGDAQTECERGVKEACWMIRFGRCAHENPRIAIPACTRQLANPRSVWDNSALSAFKRMDQAQRYSLRATAYAKLGNAEQALEDYDRAIRTDGDLYWIHALRASALYGAGFEQGALESFNDAVELAPENPLILNARARLLSTALDENVRNSAQAIADAQRAGALAPGQPTLLQPLRQFTPKAEISKKRRKRNGAPSIYWGRTIKTRLPTIGTGLRSTSRV